MPQCLSSFVPVLLGALAAAQDVASIEGLVEGLCGHDVAVRNRAFAQLVSHPEPRAVAAAMGRLLPREPAPRWNTAVGLGGGGGRKYAPRPREPETVLWTDAPVAPPCVFQDDLDFAYAGWSVPALAATILGRLGPDALAELDALVRTLSAHEEGVSSCAAWALTQMGPEGVNDLVGRRQVSGRNRADILMAYSADVVGVAKVAELIRSRATEQGLLGCRLAAGWRLDEEEVRAALVFRAAVRGETRNAVSALLALETPAVPDLIALVRGSARPAATTAAAAFVPLLARPTPLPAVVRRDAIDALCGLALNDEVEVDAAHAALCALAPVEIDTDVRSRLRARVEAWCRSDEAAWRFLGFRHLGAFGGGAESAELVAQGLRDEFHNIVEEAAIAASRVGVPMSETICRRLCDSVSGVSRGARVLLRFVAEDARAAGMLRSEHARDQAMPRELLHAAAERDDERVLASSASWAPKFLAETLLAMGPLTPQRWHELDAISRRDHDRLRVLVEVLSRQVEPAAAGLALLIRAVDVGVEEPWERGGQSLAADALDVLARMSPEPLAPHRDVFLRALHGPWLRVRQGAAALLRTMPR